MKWACFRSSEIWPNQHSYFKIILPLYMIISLLHWILFYEKMEIYSIFARLKCIFYHIINFSYAYFQFEFAFNIHLWEQLLRQYPFSAFTFFFSSSFFNRCFRTRKSTLCWAESRKGQCCITGILSELLPRDEGQVWTNPSSTAWDSYHQHPLGRVSLH